MMTVRVNGQPLLLPEDFAMTWELINPAFAMDATTGDFVYPIEIPATEENNAALGWPATIKNLQQEFKVDVEVYDDDHIYQRGVLIIDRPGTTKHSGVIKTGSQSWSVMDKKLNEVDYGGAVVMGTTTADVLDYAKDTVLTYYRWYERGVYFPTIIAANFYSAQNTDFLAMINRWDDVNQEFVSNDLTPPLVNRNALVPMPYVFYIIRKICEEAGYVLPDTALDSISCPLFRDMMLFSNKPLDEFGEAHYQVYVEAKSKTYLKTDTRLEFDNESSPYYDPDGVWDTGANEYEVQVSGLHKVSVYYKFKWNRNGSGNQALVRASIMLDTIVLKQWSINLLHDGQEYVISMEVEADLLAGDIGKKIKIALVHLPYPVWGTGNPGMITQDGWIKIEARDNNFANVFTKSYDIRNHVPDMTVRDLFFELSKMGINIIPKESNRTAYVVFSGNWLPLNSSGSGVSGQMVDLTEKLDPEHVAVDNELRVRKIGYVWPSDDSLTEAINKPYDKNKALADVNSLTDYSALTISVPGQSVLIKEAGYRILHYASGGGLLSDIIHDYPDYYLDPQGSRDIELNITPMLMHYDTLPGAINPVLMPKTEIVAQSAAWDTGGPITAPRFMYRSDYNRGTGFFYPLATSQQVVESTGQNNLGSRLVEDADGTPAGMLAYLYGWLKGISARWSWEKDGLLDANDLNRLKDPYKGIFYGHLYDQAIVMIKRVTVNIGKAVNVAKVEFVKRANR